jgi:hypothetical protein
MSTPELSFSEVDHRLAEFRAACPHSEIVYDEEVGAILDTETGELLWVAPPDPALSEREIAEWVGERRARANARLAGLVAEKDAWLEKVAAQFDSLITRKVKYIEHLDESFRPVLDRLAHQELGGRKERTCRIGLLTLRLRRTRPRIDVEIEQVALEWAREHCAGAIRTTERLLKSEIPPELIQEFGIESGLSYYPGGEDELIIE